MANLDLLFIGGHHSSALPLALLFKKEGYSLAFIGHKYNSKSNKYVSSEFKEVTSYKIPYTHLDSPKFYRVPGFKKYFKFLRSFLFCLVFLIKNRPKVIISYGGYLSVPVVMAGYILRIPAVTHEQTSVSGLANKVITRFSKLVFLTWESSLKYYPKDKCIVVGLPLRKEILKIKPRTFNGKCFLKTLFIQGGKQGSHALNEFVFENIKYLSSKFKIYHSTGSHSITKDYERAMLLRKKHKNYYPFDYKFGESYRNILKKSDFLISRSGAHIVYELSYLKIPTIFVPIPWSSNEEQKNNALVAQEYLPSVLLDQKNLNLKEFNKAFNLLNKKIKQGNNSFKKVPLNATEKMYTEIKNRFFK